MWRRKTQLFRTKNWQTSKSIFVTHERKESVSSWNWKWNGVPMIWYRMHHEKCSRKLNRTNRKTQTKQIKSNTSTNNNESAWLLPPIYSWINIETESLALNTTATRRHTFPDLFYCQKCIDSIGFCSVFFCSLVHCSIWFGCVCLFRHRRCRGQQPKIYERRKHLSHVVADWAQISLVDFILPFRRSMSNASTLQIDAQWNEVIIRQLPSFASKKILLNGIASIWKKKRETWIVRCGDAIFLACLLCATQLCCSCHCNKNTKKGLRLYSLHDVLPCSIVYRLQPRCIATIVQIVLLFFVVVSTRLKVIPCTVFSSDKETRKQGDNETREQGDK